MARYQDQLYLLLPTNDGYNRHGHTNDCHTEINTDSLEDERTNANKRRKKKTCSASPRIELRFFDSILNNPSPHTDDDDDSKGRSIETEVEEKRPRPGRKFVSTRVPRQLDASRSLMVEEMGRDSARFRGKREREGERGAEKSGGGI